MRFYVNEHDSSKLPIMDKQVEQVTGLTETFSFPLSQSTTFSPLVEDILSYDLRVHSFLSDYLPTIHLCMNGSIHFCSDVSKTSQRIHVTNLLDSKAPMPLSTNQGIKVGKTAEEVEIVMNYKMHVL